MSQWEVGQVIAGAYRLSSLLGEGGMAQVWEAEDMDLDRVVALKVARRIEAPVDLRAEARLMAALDSPGLPTVHGIATDGDEEVIVMERLRGVTLYELIDANEELIGIEEGLDLLIAVADVLASIHRAGLVHGDLKSENVMACAGKRIVLLDLGVMQSLDGDPPAELYCSPHCAAPELITRAPMNGRRHLADVYAFGVLAYEMFCGELPFLAESLAELLQRHLEAEPTPLRFHRDDLPQPLQQLILSALAKQTYERPQSMDVIAATLRGIRRGRTRRTAGRDLSVLIVDDDPDIRLLLEACVEHAAVRAEIRSVDSAEAALSMVREGAPDLLLLDLQLPRMSGVELCARLRATHIGDETTIVAVSGNASASERAQLEALGVVRFVDKRVDSEELISELVTLVRAIDVNRGDWAVAMEEASR
jgi:serine/threonine protein kinase